MQNPGTKARKGNAHTLDKKHAMQLQPFTSTCNKKRKMNNTDPLKYLEQGPGVQVE